MKQNQSISFWYSTFDEPLVSRPPLVGDIQADVAIVGAGYTGLWTAYYLKKHSPERKVVVIDARTAGFGASGRNGGWVAGYITGLEKYVANLNQATKREICQTLFNNVDEIGRRLQEESIHADFHKGGVLYAAARYPEQIALQRKVLEGLYGAGHTEEDCWWLNARELEDHVRLRNGYGAVFKRHCATVNPAKMVRGLARVVESLGVTIYEQTPARAVRPHEVITKNGKISSSVVVPALEGYSSTVNKLGNYVIPVQSLIVATEPLPDSIWDQIGLANRPAFCDGSRMVSYGQRSADNRLIFGARGGYVFGAKPRSSFSLEDEEFILRKSLMHDLLPMLKDVKITHGWGGSLGVSRGFAPYAVIDRESGIAAAGGYGGQGVGPSHLFGRTLADLILNRQTDLTTMPWVFNGSHQRSLKRWEPEPLRWITSQAIIKAFTWEENLYLAKEDAKWKKCVANRLSSGLSLLMR